MWLMTILAIAVNLILCYSQCEELSHFSTRLGGVDGADPHMAVALFCCTLQRCYFCWL